MQPAVFLDRDGTIIEDTGFVHRVEDLVFLPGAVDALAELKRAGFLLLVVTNQSGVARGLYDEAAVHLFHAAMNEKLVAHGAAIDAFYYCPDHPEAVVAAHRRESPLRKPQTGMFQRACQDFAVQVDASYMVGDRLSDMEFARNAGLRGILVRTGHGAAQDAVTSDRFFEVENGLREAAARIARNARAMPQHER